jgi:hypothetical protein
MLAEHQAGDSGRAGPKAGGGAETPADSSAAGRVTDETDYFRFADHTDFATQHVPSFSSISMIPRSTVEKLNFSIKNSTKIWSVLCRTSQGTRRKPRLLC